MHTRFVVATLWFFAALYAGSMLHNIAGLHEVVGLAVGLPTAAAVVADPFNRLAGRASRVHEGRPSAQFETVPRTGTLATR